MQTCDLVAPYAWGIDDTGFTKDCESSPGVAWQCTLGKADNCQIAVSVHAASDAASAPLGWRHFLPRELGRLPTYRDTSRADDGTLPAAWLLAVWHTGADEPTDYWPATLPEVTPRCRTTALTAPRAR